ncbi:uncharacterized protein LOC127808864 [Diospyros lotus]|uniref:uncharacterized protein LOC127808864 n=1 Tax=Diospyros lotus TaxID=55363 RepID=UPI0022577298|nr:uncharacterized protein LOC127808864 [Diospyros lotus]
MGTQKSSSDRQKWKKIFNALVHMLQTQQTQLESLAKERKLLEDRIKLQHERWISDVNLCKDHVSQMKRDLTVEVMTRNFEGAKSDLVVGLKRREAFIYKVKLDDAVSELEDFRLWFDYLSHKCSENKNKENSSEMLALLSERNFVWNQYKERETDLTNRLKSKSAEVEQANSKVQILLSSMEQLRSSNSEKDDMILKLKANMAEIEASSAKKNEEISRLARELESLRKARSDSVTPVLRHCSAGSRLGDKNRGTDSSNIIPKKGTHPSRFEKGSRSSKRKADDGILLPEAPRLFTSSFKVPKLKNSSPRVI